MATLEPLQIEPGVGLTEIRIGMPTTELAARFSSYHETIEEGWDTGKDEPFELRVGWIDENQYASVWVSIETRDGTSRVASVSSDNADLVLVTAERGWRLGEVTEDNVLEVFASLGVRADQVSIERMAEAECAIFDASGLGLCFVFNLNSDPTVIIEAPRA